MLADGEAQALDRCLADLAAVEVDLGPGANEEVDAAVAALTSLIEPIIIVLMGVVIGFILVSMYLPMFDIIGKIS